jgi:hypothetical protein
MAAEIDPSNRQMVGSQGEAVVVLFPNLVMTPVEALTHAAWLVAVSEVVDPSLRFADFVEAVRNT